MMKAESSGSATESVQRCDAPRFRLRHALTHAPRDLLSTVGRAPRNLAHVLRPDTVRGAFVEVIWTSAHLAVYPMGVMRERRAHEEPYDLESLSPHQRGLIHGDVEAAGTPILMIHGIVDNRAIFLLLRRGLRSRGFGHVFTINYSPLTNDIRSSARNLSAAVEELVAVTGYERIHVIGHSMGGLIARYYVQRLGGDERVHTLVTMGTPHGGTELAHWLPVNIGRQLRPGSELLRELDEPAVGCRTRIIAYWSDIDQVLFPRVTGRLEHPDLRVTNVLVPNVGHLSIPAHPGVVRGVAQLLATLDSDGHTLAEGVSVIPRSSPAERRMTRARDDDPPEWSNDLPG